MNILGIDPSFVHLASSLFVQDRREIYINMSSCKLGENIGFDKVYNACHVLWNDFHKTLDKIGVGTKFNIDVVASEVPPPTNAQFSSGLYALDIFILSKLFETYTSIKEIWFIPPSYLATVHGTSKYAKSDSTKLANYFLNEVFEKKYKTIIPDSVSENGRRSKGKLNNDRAESFLFLLRMMCKYDIDGVAHRVISEMGGLGEGSEKLLISRK